MSLRVKLEQVERATGKRPPELDHEEIPKAALDAWGFWNDLHAGRFYNGMGISPLSWLEFDSWSRARKHGFTFTELELIRTIDRAYVAQAAKGK